MGLRPKQSALASAVIEALAAEDEDVDLTDEEAFARFDQRCSVFLDVLRRKAVSKGEDCSRLVAELMSIRNSRREQISVRLHQVEVRFVVRGVSASIHRGVRAALETAFGDPDMETEDSAIERLQVVVWPQNEPQPHTLKGRKPTKAKEQP